MIFGAKASNRTSTTRRWSPLHAAGIVVLSGLFALCILAVLVPASRAQTLPNCSGEDPVRDRDGDSLTDRQDCLGGFDTDWWDTDDDGQGDAFEDSDRDNLATHEEFKAGFNPLKAESDATLDNPLGNGIRDDFEDRDRDGLDTWEEFTAHATIKGKSCGAQNFRGALKPKTPTFDPRDSNSLTLVEGRCVETRRNDGKEDIDRDGLTTSEEFDLRWDPNNPDTDGDTIPDGREPGPGDEVGRKFRA